MIRFRVAEWVKDVAKAIGNSMVMDDVMEEDAIGSFVTYTDYRDLKDEISDLRDELTDKDRKIAELENLLSKYD